MTPAKDTAQVSATVGSRGTVFTSGEVKAAPDTTSTLKVPYADVLADYEKAAENALAQERIPPAYKARVKKYFGSLAR